MGDIVFFDYYSSISRRDGTFECIVVYRELSEAQLGAKLDGTELGDRCLEVRLSNSIDRFDIGFEANGPVSNTSSRTLLIKGDDTASSLETLKEDFKDYEIHRCIELERDLGAGLPALTARFFLVEFSSLEVARGIQLPQMPSSHSYSMAEATKHLQTYTGSASQSGPGSFSYNTSSTSGNTDEVLIYGVPASKLLDPTTSRSYNKEVEGKPSSSSSYHHQSSRTSRSRSRSRESGRNRYRQRTRDYDRHRRSRSRSGERHRRH